MELGAFSVFLYMIKAREWLWELVEEVTGARLTVSYGRIGGVKADLTADFSERCREVIGKVEEVLEEVDDLLTHNRIFYDRMRGVGVISAESAVAYGITGPFLRSTGIDYDVRKAFPYFVYDRMDFDVPVGEQGDNMDRYLVRMEEMRQSLRIIEQCLEQMPEGPTNVDPEGRLISPRPDGGSGQVRQDSRPPEQRGSDPADPPGIGEALPRPGLRRRQDEPASGQGAGPIPTSRA